MIRPMNPLHMSSLLHSFHCKVSFFLGDNDVWDNKAIRHSVNPLMDVLAEVFQTGKASSYLEYILISKKKKKRKQITNLYLREGIKAFDCNIHCPGWAGVSQFILNEKRSIIFEPMHSSYLHLYIFFVHSHWDDSRVWMRMRFTNINRMAHIVHLIVESLLSNVPRRSLFDIWIHSLFTHFVMSIHILWIILVLNIPVSFFIFSSKTRLSQYSWINTDPYHTWSFIYIYMRTRHTARIMRTIHTT